MVNELKEICDKLAGYDPEKHFEVLAATKTAEGAWELTVKRVNPEARTEVAADAEQ